MLFRSEYLVDISIYCVITWICVKLIIKELARDCGFRWEISAKYSLLFLPFLLLPMFVIAINSIYVMHQYAKVALHVKSYFYYISPYFSTKYELWTFSMATTLGYIFLKFVYHFKLRREIAQRNEKILTEIEHLVRTDEENSKTPNHIEYL